MFQAGSLRAVHSEQHVADLEDVRPLGDRARLELSDAWLPVLVDAARDRQAERAAVFLDQFNRRSALGYEDRTRDAKVFFLSCASETERNREEAPSTQGLPREDRAGLYAAHLHMEMARLRSHNELPLSQLIPGTSDGSRVLKDAIQ